MGYVRGRFQGRVQLMHRVLADAFLGAKPGQVVDHINGNKLDNRLSNLRVCLQRENARNVPMKRNNTSGFVGVSWDRTRGKWLAHIKVNRKFVNLGMAHDEGSRGGSANRWRVPVFQGIRLPSMNAIDRSNPRCEVEVEPLVPELFAPTPIARPAPIDEPVPF